MRRLSKRRSPNSKSPSSLNGKPRAISYTTTTTTKTYSVIEDGNEVMSDVENWDAQNRPGPSPLGKDGKSSKSGSGSGSLGVTKVRSTGSPVRRSPESRGEGKMSVSGVRKTSGRVGSINAARTRREAA